MFFNKFRITKLDLQFILKKGVQNDVKSGIMFKFEMTCKELKKK